MGPLTELSPPVGLLASHEIHFSTPTSLKLHPSLHLLPGATQTFPLCWDSDMVFPRLLVTTLLVSLPHSLGCEILRTQENALDQ